MLDLNVYECEFDTWKTTWCEECGSEIGYMYMPPKICDECVYKDLYGRKEEISSERI